MYLDFVLFVLVVEPFSDNVTEAPKRQHLGKMT